MPLQINSRFLSMVVHDLRTPLNVIFLSLRMIEQALPKGDPEPLEDFRMVQENVHQIKDMLTYMSEYCRLLEEPPRLGIAPIDPRWLLSELADAPEARSGCRGTQVRLEVRGDCPAEVELDPVKARLAMQMALTNAASASGGDPVRVLARGGPDRLVVEFAVDRSPPPTVQPELLRPDSYERLFGVEAERRGLDLAIAARISEFFGGSARLEVAAGRGSSIVLDWPSHLPRP